MARAHYKPQAARMVPVLWERGRKKARLLPAGLWKFWERMPERPVPYAAERHIVQVRKAHQRLQNTQHAFALIAI
jgi:hypothetical protein